MIKMEELRKTFEALGFDRVVSYINSGNLAFDIRKTSETNLIKKIESAVEGLIDKRVQVMVREQPEIERVVANNPFTGKYQSHKEMHELFLKSKLSAEQMGVADSYLGRGLFEKKLKAAVTARNWRTVEKLAEL
jgi:uncharacterized protein (DUF1697 family)